MGLPRRARPAGALRTSRKVRKRQSHAVEQTGDDLESEVEPRSYKDDVQHQVLKSQWSSNQSAISCEFWCGAKSLDTDEENEDVPMKWCYKNDYYCERVFAKHYRHTHERVELQNQIKKGGKIRAEFLGRRKEFVVGKRQGKIRVKQKDFKRKTLKQTTTHKDRLIIPDDEFWPLDRYVNLHGDPRSKENKGKGHKVCRKHGIKGVLVPGDDGVSPFIVRREFEDALANEKEMECDLDSDVSSGQIDLHFDEAVAQREAAHSSAASGIIAAVLAEFAPVDDDEEEQQGGTSIVALRRKEGKAEGAGRVLTREDTDPSDVPPKKAAKGARGKSTPKLCRSSPAAHSKQNAGSQQAATPKAVSSRTCQQKGRLAQSQLSRVFG